MAFSSSTSLSFSLLLLSLLSLSSAQTLTKAAGILSNSGYKYMSFTLEITSNSSLISDPPSLTVFAPADAAFINSGQTGVYLLHYHLLPFYVNLQLLKSLRFGTRISTLLAGHSLTVTTLRGDRHVSLNNVTVAASPIFDDGSLVIYGVHTFFDPRFRISAPIRNPRTTAHYVSKAIEVMKSKGYPGTAAREAGKVIKSRGSSAIASFVEMKILDFVKYQARLTFSRHVGHVTVNRFGGLSQYSPILRRHVPPCKLFWFMSRNDSVLVLNGVVMPETCRNDWVVVPGISEVLELAESPTTVTFLWLWNTATVMFLWLWNTAPVKFLFTSSGNIYGEWPFISCLTSLFIYMCFEALGVGV